MLRVILSISICETTIIKFLDKVQTQLTGFVLNSV